MSETLSIPAKLLLLFKLPPQNNKRIQQDVCWSHPSLSSIGLVVENNNNKLFQMLLSPQQDDDFVVLTNWFLIAWVIIISWYLYTIFSTCIRIITLISYIPSIIGVKNKCTGNCLLIINCLFFQSPRVLLKCSVYLWQLF